MSDMSSYLYFEKKKDKKETPYMDISEDNE